MAERPYCFWLTFVFDVFKFLAQAGIAAGLFYLGTQTASKDAQPRLALIGDIPQFPADDRFLTVRLKNFSTRLDADVTGLEFIVTDPTFLKHINKRYEFAPNAPPPPIQEHLLKGPNLELTHGDWSQDGKAFSFCEDVDLTIPPGKREALRLRLGNPVGNPKLWSKAWMNGTLIFHYDDGATVPVPGVVTLLHEDSPLIPSIPPVW